MQKISVSIPGGNGRMGRTLIRLILENPKYKLSNATCLPGEEEEGIDIGLLVGKNKIENTLKSDPSNLFNEANVLIDFTVPEATMFHARKASINNVAMVIWTTGLSVDNEQELLEISKKIPIVYY